MPPEPDGSPPRRRAYRRHDAARTAEQLAHEHNRKIPTRASTDASRPFPRVGRRSRSGLRQPERPVDQSAPALASERVPKALSHLSHISAAVALTYGKGRIALVRTSR